VCCGGLCTCYIMTLLGFRFFPPSLLPTEMRFFTTVPTLLEPPTTLFLGYQPVQRPCFLPGPLWNPSLLLHPPIFFFTYFRGSMFFYCAEYDLRGLLNSLTCCFERQVFVSVEPILFPLLPIFLLYFPPGASMSHFTFTR